MKQEKKEHIDKAIYKISKYVKKQYQFLIGGFICSAIGIICFVIYFLYGDYINAHATFSEVFMSIMLVGLLGLISTICFYWFGDCYHPLYIPTNELLNREELFFDYEQKNVILSAIEQGDIAAIDNMSKSVQVQVVVIKYSNSDKSFIAAQAFINDDFQYIPLSQILKIEK